ncbi:MAG: hypothetical protein ABMA13_00640 [Chthoniobacteraceae bacterium]
MRRSLLLSLTAGLVLAGCGALRPSATWSLVRAARVETRDAADPSAAFAVQLGAVLKSAGVEHKVVTYEFSHRTRRGEEVTATRTAVVYRDGACARSPWWLMDERLRAPAWLPGEDLGRQLSFYARRRATVLSVAGGSSRDNGGTRLAQLQPGKPSFLARLWPIRKTERSRRFAPQPVVHRDEITPRMLSQFRAQHGTNFDPACVLDRVKMDRLAGGPRVVAGL